MENEKDIVEAFKNIIYYSTKQWTLTNYYKRKFKYNGNKNAVKLIEDFEIVGKEFKQDLNENIAKWFKELLDLACENWNSDNADSISKYYIGRDYIFSKLKTLHSAKMKMYKSLLHQDKNFLSYTLDFI